MQPNTLIFMVDQLNGTLFPDGPADWLKVPNLRCSQNAVSGFRMPMPQVRCARRGACEALCNHMNPGALEEEKCFPRGG